MAQDKRPNILFIMADQMAAPMLSMYDPASVIKTPTLDRLAKESVVFESAYCNSPLCAPSRFSLVTGQLPSKIDGYDNASELSSRTLTYAHYLRLEGYHTALAGKMHFCGADQLHGYEERLTSDIYPGDFGWTVNWDEPDVRPDWYHNMSSVYEAGPIVRTNQLDYDEEVLYKAKQYLFDHVRRKGDQPFCLTASFTHPHDPYNMTRDYYELYEDVDIPLPKTPAFPYEQQDPHAQRLMKVIDAAGKDLTDEQIREARRSYFASCTYVDHQINELLKTLENCGFGDNTIVVFSGDHGDMLGERGLWYKMNWFENSGRVPLLVHAPGRFSPRRVKENVSTMDLMPTFVELIGSNVSPDLPLDGVSLVPYITDSQAPKLDTVIGEYMGEGTLAPLVMIRRGRYKFVYCPLDPPQLYDLIDDPREINNLAAAYTSELPTQNSFNRNINDGNFGVLQDLSTEQIRPSAISQSDPLFPVRIASPSPPRTPSPKRKDINAPLPPAHVQEILRRFFQETAERWDFTALTKQVLLNQRQRRLVSKALLKGRVQGWDFTPRADGSAQYVRNFGVNADALEDFEIVSRWPRQIAT